MQVARERGRLLAPGSGDEDDGDPPEGKICEACFITPLDLTTLDVRVPSSGLGASHSFGASSVASVQRALVSDMHG